MTGITYSQIDRRKILLENKYLQTESEICRKFKITRYQLRKWKNEFDYYYFIGSLRDMTIVALLNGATTIPALIDNLDALNHARYSENEVMELLEGLRAEGKAAQKDGKWYYVPAHSTKGIVFFF